MVKSNRLCAALARVDREILQSASEEIVARYPVKMTSLPTSGLALIQLVESVNSDAFNLGEIPLSSATVELDLGEGRVANGGAHVMADDADLAVWIAIADAAITNDLPGNEKVIALVQDGLEKMQLDQDIRQSILDRSKVRFALLNEESGS